MRTLPVDRTAEEVRQRVRANALPGVGHPKFKGRSLAAQPHAHLAAAWGELDGIGEQMGDELAQPLRITVHLADRSRKIRRDRDVLRLRGAADSLERRSGDA